MLKKIFFFVIVISILLMMNTKEIIRKQVESTPVAVSVGIEKTVLSGRKPSVFPEDVIPFDANVLQQRLGCLQRPEQYTGYSSQNNTLLAVIRSNGKDALYQYGDTFPRESQSRIVWADTKRIILRSRDELSILCQNHVDSDENIAGVESSLSGEKDTSVGTHNIENKTSASSPATTMLYSSVIGELAGVTNKDGKLTGYQFIVCRKYCWLLNKVDIKPGDIITKIQGVPVTGLSMKQIEDKIMSEHQDINITYLRGELEKHTTLSWSTLAPLLSFMSHKG